MGKARAGRKSKAGKREANGRAQRPSTASVQQNAMQAALDYRQRVFGISAADSKDQKAATLLGRLCLQGVVISRGQCSGAFRCCGLRFQWMRRQRRKRLLEINQKQVNMRANQPASGVASHVTEATNQP
jgi:hypothetical protein